MLCSDWLSSSKTWEEKHGGEHMQGTWQHKKKSTRLFRNTLCQILEGRAVIPEMETTVVSLKVERER